MAMIWESLKQQGAARRSFHAPDIDQIPADKYERLEIRDFDYDNGDSAVWHCQLQLRELFAKLPMGSRIEPDYGMWRKTWGMLGGMTTVLLIYAMVSYAAILGGPASMDRRCALYAANSPYRVTG